jgi:hypothetical protein
VDDSQGVLNSILVSEGIEFTLYLNGEGVSIIVLGLSVLSIVFVLSVVLLFEVAPSVCGVILLGGLLVLFGAQPKIDNENIIVMATKPRLNFLFNGISSFQKCVLVDIGKIIIG